ncbi:hypothetical protein AAD001_16190 [Colwelliaceae bacterium 6471]
MIKVITVFFITFIFVANVHSSDRAMDINEYNKELRLALTLYKESEYSKALPELELYAKRGDKTAQYIVGTMYLNSQGTEQDLMKSYAWLSVANEQKSKVWIKPLNMLESKLPSDYLENAQVMAKSYIDSYGVKAQRMKCSNVKELGSRKPTHSCSKMEVRKGHYYVDDETENNIVGL